MAFSLEETRAKFGVIQKSFDSQFSQHLSSGGLREFSGILMEYCCTGAPFEEWRNDYKANLNIALFNGILTQANSPEITEGELRELYNHTKRNIEGNLAESRKYCDGE